MTSHTSVIFPVSFLLSLFLSLPFSHFFSILLSYAFPLPLCIVISILTSSLLLTIDFPPPLCFSSPLVLPSLLPLLLHFVCFSWVSFFLHSFPSSLTLFCPYLSFLLLIFLPPSVISLPLYFISYIYFSPLSHFIFLHTTFFITFLPPSFLPSLGSSSPISFAST